MHHQTPQLLLRPKSRSFPRDGISKGGKYDKDSNKWQLLKSVEMGVPDLTSSQARPQKGNHSQGCKIIEFGA